MKKSKKAMRQKSDKKRSKLSAIVENIKKKKATFAVYSTLRFLTIAIMIRCIFTRQWESVFTCALALTLFLLPAFIEYQFRIELPTTLEIIAFVFVFCAEILGEINAFYIKIPIWDTMLHTTSGFLFAAFGFCLLDMLNRNKRIKIELSPLSLALVAFCFSMTIGVLWEFFEFSADMLLATDMQKDFVVGRFSTVTLDSTRSNTAVQVKDIAQTIIVHTNGDQNIIKGGYLDIGIIDTMKDLFVNFIGAVVFSAIGYIYVKQRGKGVIAKQFIPVIPENTDDTENIDDAENTEK